MTKNYDEFAASDLEHAREAGKAYKRLYETFRNELRVTQIELAETREAVRFREERENMNAAAHIAAELKCAELAKEVEALRAQIEELNAELKYWSNR